MAPKITIGRAYLLRAEGDTDERRFTQRRETPADDAGDEQGSDQIEIRIAANGDALIQWPEPAAPGMPRRSLVLPAEIAAKLLLDPAALRANGVKVTHA